MTELSRVIRICPAANRNRTITPIVTTSVARALNAAGSSPPASVGSEHWPLPLGAHRRWVNHQPGALKGAFRVVEGKVSGLGGKWTHDYGRGSATCSSGPRPRPLTTRGSSERRLVRESSSTFYAGLGEVTRRVSAASSWLKRSGLAPPIWCTNTGCRAHQRRPPAPPAHPHARWSQRCHEHALIPWWWLLQPAGLGESEKPPMIWIVVLLLILGTAAAIGLRIEARTWRDRPAEPSQAQQWRAMGGG